MKIHTSLSAYQMRDLLQASGAPIGYHNLEGCGSRTHAHGYHVTLEGSGGRNNTGMYGSGDYNGATWDEWGAFFGALFEADPEARCGGTLVNPTYRNASHFHYLTGGRFENTEDTIMHLPHDTHSRHQWKYDNANVYSNARHCAKCSARQPEFVAGKDWS